MQLKEGTRTLEGPGVQIFRSLHIFLEAAC